MNQNTVDKILSMLPATNRELGDKLGMRRATVIWNTTNLHRATPKRIYVSNFIKCPNGGVFERVYSVGSLPDVPTPVGKYSRKPATTDPLTDEKREWLKKQKKAKKWTTLALSEQNTPFSELFKVQR